jgi:hypothetical protein
VSLMLAMVIKSDEMPRIDAVVDLKAAWNSTVSASVRLIPDKLCQRFKTKAIVKVQIG